VLPAVKWVFLLALALSLAAAGCGGGSSSSPKEKADEAAAKRRAAFVTRADTICIKYRRATLSLRRPTTLAEFKRYAGAGIALGERQYRELSALNPPRAMRRTYRAYLEQLAASLDAARELETGIVKRNSTQVQVAQNRVRAIAADMSDLAESIGLGGCSQNRIQARPTGQ